jgi:hypothetical protein
MTGEEQFEKVKMILFGKENILLHNFSNTISPLQRNFSLPSIA